MSKDSSFDLLEVQTASLTQATAKIENRTPKSSIIRGPYLQQGTDSSIIIRWATNIPAQGSVLYGTEPHKLLFKATETAITCDHTVKLQELESDTKYYYAIATSAEVTQSSEDNFFVTAPKQPKPTRIWVVGDSGRGNDIAAQVRDGYLKFTGTRHTDLWLMLGDNAYDTGTWDEYQQGVFEMYPQILRNSVLWTAIGNHDAGSASSEWQTGPYYELFNPPTQGEAGGVPSGTAAYYSFDYGNIHFICLDSYGSDRASTGAMLTWAAEDAAESDKDWQIAFWHHPPYTKGSHDSDTEIELIEMRERALPVLEAAGVDLVLSGHSHSYERSYLIDGHYGTSDTFTLQMMQDRGSGQEDNSGAYQKPSDAAHTGTVYIVAGTSARADEVSPHPAMHTSLSIPGSLVLDVQEKRLDVTFVDDLGEVQDYFTMKKG
ncbi:metallophosphoesterase family protein [Gloeocapsopsis crepidinum LEGE 06123]|uniref:Metallophosphoesterase family protein n=1 Tax=Gloeocapsopsis crepidinum LEGE 06123 TaxID=588587 RepID=A0ABR9UW96_9CHRO|nr:metallophosphoesterase family protein [Gloeocapsopsis crepidinum]MBE9192574.1 metallophosphoesterase family protein [Gloeocapsopsis crepidinum LEGE 06123]